jgi:hypothetical protein
MFLCIGPEMPWLHCCYLLLRFILPLQSAETVAQTLYKRDSHFVMELVQNAGVYVMPNVSVQPEEQLQCS